MSAIAVYAHAHARCSPEIGRQGIREGDALLIAARNAPNRLWVVAWTWPSADQVFPLSVLAFDRLAVGECSAGRPGAGIVLRAFPIAGNALERCIHTRDRTGQPVHVVTSHGPGDTHLVVFALALVHLISGHQVWEIQERCAIAIAIAIAVAASIAVAVAVSASVSIPVAVSVAVAVSASVSISISISIAVAVATFVVLH
jgi:hypothetical protein